MKKESKMGKERFSRFCDIVNEDVMREEVESSKLFIKAQESYHKNYVSDKIKKLTFEFLSIRCNQRLERNIEIATRHPLRMNLIFPKIVWSETTQLEYTSTMIRP